MKALILVFLAACGTAPTGAPSTDPAATPAAAPAGAEGSEVVGRVAGTEITLAEVDAKAGAALMQARQGLFDARQAALEGLIADRLLDAEAAKRGMDRDAFLVAEVDAKLPPVDPAEVMRLYESNKARMGDPPFEEVKPRIEAFLGQQGKGTRMAALLAELKAAGDAQMLLDPPRTALTVPADAPASGSASAPVQIVEWSDFQCPYCTRGAETITQVKAKYGDKVNVVFRHFPLDFHAEARKAAEASICAQEQGKFWEYHDVLFRNQQALAVPALQAYATELGLDAAVFTECLGSGKHAPKVQADFEAGQAVGVTGTPGFFVNGRFLGGALPIDAFSEIIDQELARK